MLLYIFQKKELKALNFNGFNRSFQNKPTLYKAQIVNFIIPLKAKITACYMEPQKLGIYGLKLANMQSSVLNTRVDSQSPPVTAPAFMVLLTMIGHTFETK